MAHVCDTHLRIPNTHKYLQHACTYSTHRHAVWSIARNLASFILAINQSFKACTGGYRVEKSHAYAQEHNQLHELLSCIQEKRKSRLRKIRNTCNNTRGLRFTPDEDFCCLGYAVLADIDSVHEMGDIPWLPREDEASKACHGPSDVRSGLQEEGPESVVEADLPSAHRQMEAEAEEAQGAYVSPTCVSSPCRSPFHLAPLIGICGPKSA
jgi:hypothetical protein